jgi:cysteine-rich repeat protein
MRRFAVLLSLVSCVTDTPAPEAFFEGETEGLPSEFPPARTDMLPPPLSLTADPIIPGQNFFLIANGANPGDTVYFVRSPTLGSLCAPVLGGNCLGITQPVVMGSAVAGAAGLAVFSVQVPVSAPIGFTMHFQAGVLGANGYVSNLETRTSEGLCGDGILTSDEECDDGNTVNLDGCTDACTIDRCGDGILQQGEICDDGNTQGGDGCGPTCQLDCCVDDFSITLYSAEISAIDPDGDAWDDFLILPPFIDPDPYVRVVINNTVIGETLLVDDTLSPVWNASFNVNVQDGDILRLRILDADNLAADQLIDVYELTWTELNDFRGGGLIEGTGNFSSEFFFEISAVP